MIISVNGLIKQYKNKKVLDIPKLTLNSGLIHAVIGPNGAGKSTLIKILAGIELADSGLVSYNGDSLNARVQKKITLLFQKPFMLRGTVYDNLAYPLKLRQINQEEIHNNVIDFLSELDLFDIRNQNALTLSGGEAQKVALARALIFKPELVLLDEPTASIDPLSTLMIEKMVTNTNKNEGTTFLWITHNINQAKRTASKIIFMHKGKVIDYDSANRILYNPQKEITKNFVNGDLII